MRRYEPELEPSSSNRILLHFSTNDTDKDMLLFHLGKDGDQVNQINKNSNSQSLFTSDVVLLIPLHPYLHGTNEIMFTQARKIVKYYALLKLV